MWKIIETREEWEREFETLARASSMLHPTGTPSTPCTAFQILKEYVSRFFHSCLGKMHPGELVTDPDFLTQTLRENLEGYGLTLSCAPSPIAALRRIKSPEEIQKLRTSQTMNKQVFEKIQQFLQPGVTERDVARQILILQLELGAQGPSFPPIVAFGENSAVPHHSSSDRKLQP